MDHQGSNWTGSWVFEHFFQEMENSNQKTSEQRRTTSPSQCDLEDGGEDVKLSFWFGFAFSYWEMTVHMLITARLMETWLPRLDSGWAWICLKAWSSLNLDYILTLWIASSHFPVLTQPETGMLPVALTRAFLHYRLSAEERKQAAHVPFRSSLVDLTSHAGMRISKDP